MERSPERMNPFHLIRCALELGRISLQRGLEAVDNNIYSEDLYPPIRNVEVPVEREELLY